MFFSADFDLYEPRFQGDSEWNQRRLAVRKRLQALGEELKKAYAALGIGLDRRESLHNPHATNGKRVRRQRTMLFRDKKSRKGLQDFSARNSARIWIRRAITSIFKFASTTPVVGGGCGLMNPLGTI